MFLVSVYSENIPLDRLSFNAFPSLSLGKRFLSVLYVKIGICQLCNKICLPLIYPRIVV